MNKQIKDGGPAFPHQDFGDTGTRTGMNLRDYFAAKAISFAAECEREFPTDENAGGFYAGIALRAYLLADAMLVARENTYNE